MFPQGNGIGGVEYEFHGKHKDAENQVGLVLE
jgi:hypothetical protein